MTLDEFIIEKRAEIETFRAWWLENHQKAPEKFPLEVPAENAGLWDEMLLDFDQSSDEAPEEPDKEKSDG
jgi:hypothetical protein